MTKKKTTVVVEYIGGPMDGVRREFESVPKSVVVHRFEPSGYWEYVYAVRPDAGGGVLKCDFREKRRPCRDGDAR